jgi:hypothetical protein
MRQEMMLPVQMGMAADKSAIGIQQIKTPAVA